MLDMAKRYFGEEYFEGLQGIFIHVPKTGGNTIRRLWPKEVLCCLGHVPWFDVKRAMYRAGGADSWERCFKFSLVRNPWDRVVSHFYASGIRSREYKQQHNKNPHALDEHRRMFQHWLRHEGRDMVNGPAFRPEGLLTKASTGLMVDHVFRFEDFAANIEALKEKFGPLIEDAGLHENASKLRPPGTHYSYYYAGDEFIRGTVAGWGWWEIKHYGYTFETA